MIFVQRVVVVVVQQATSKQATSNKQEKKNKKSKQDDDHKQNIKHIYCNIYIIKLLTRGSKSNQMND